MPYVNSVPYEIVAAPFTVYVGAVGATFPLIDAAPGVAWTKLGTSGDKNYFQEGVTVEHPQAITVFRALGHPGPRKTFRNEEDCKIRLTVADMTLEQLANALNGNTVTTVAAGVGTAGYKKIGLSRGLNIATLALLVRGPGASPYGSDWNVQYEVPLVQVTSSPKIAYRRNEPAGYELEFTALVDPDAASDDEAFGRLLAQHADPS